MTDKIKDKNHSKNKNTKGATAVPLSNRIDFTAWLIENPKMRPKKSKKPYRGTSSVGSNK